MAASAIAFGLMGSTAVNDFIFLEPTFRRTLRIWLSWLWRWAVLGCTPVALAYSVDYYNSHLSKPFGLVTLTFYLLRQIGVVAPFWAYAYTFRLIFDKPLGEVRIRLQPLSQVGSANQPQTFLTPTRLLTGKIRKKWTLRSWRWGLGSLIASLLYGFYALDGWLKRPHALTGPDSTDQLVSSFLIITLFFGAPLGWLVGTALELKSIFKQDFGEFRVCLTSEPYLGQPK